jgi:Exopolysaccharide synthesis, ExoD.
VVLFLEILCLVSGLAMPFLEVIPFSASIVASGVLLLTLSMLTRDGLFFVLAMLPYAGLLYLLGGRIL